MAKKKSVKKTKKKVTNSKKLVRSTKNKIKLSLKNLIIFGVLSLISFLLYNVSSSEFYQDLFTLASMILGFIAFAFFIVLLVFFALKLISK